MPRSCALYGARLVERPRWPYRKDFSFQSACNRACSNAPLFCPSPRLGRRSRATRTGIQARDDDGSILTFCCLSGHNRHRLCWRLTADEAARLLCSTQVARQLDLRVRRLAGLHTMHRAMPSLTERRVAVSGRKASKPGPDASEHLGHERSLTRCPRSTLTRNAPEGFHSTRTYRLRGWCKRPTGHLRWRLVALLPAARPSRRAMASSPSERRQEFRDGGLSASQMMARRPCPLASVALFPERAVVVNGLGLERSTYHGCQAVPRSLPERELTFPW